MERKLNKLEHAHVEVLVTLTEEEWKSAQKKAYGKEMKNVSFKGFRKGNVPEAIVKKNHLIDQVKVMDSAINALLPDIFKEIIDKDDVHPFAQPKVDVTKLSETELEVKFTIVTAPEMELGAYTGLKIGHADIKVTDDDVKDALDAVVKSQASLIVKEGAAALNDTVVMDFVGKVDGKEFDGGSAQNHELKLGSHQFIPGFEEQLVGAKAGDHVDVNVKFPENYTDELKGKDATFACDIHEVKEEKLPELNDELVKELKINGVETVDALKEYKKTEITNKKTGEARRDYMAKLLDKIAAGSKTDIPDEIIDQQVASRKQDVVNRMSQSGLTLDQYLSIIGQKEEDFMANLKKESTRDFINYMIMLEVAKKENMVIAEADLEFEYARIADQYKMKVEDVKKALEPQKEEFRNNIQMQKVEDFLFNKNN